jgi:hypothetical protein
MKKRDYTAVLNRLKAGINSGQQFQWAHDRLRNWHYDSRRRGFEQNLYDALGLTPVERKRMKFAVASSKRLSPLYINNRTNGIALVVSKQRGNDYQLAGDLWAKHTRLLSGSSHRIIVYPTAPYLGFKYGSGMKLRSEYLDGKVVFADGHTPQGIPAGVRLHFDNILKMNEWPEHDDVIESATRMSPHGYNVYFQEEHYAEGYHFLHLYQYRPYHNLKHYTRRFSRKRCNGAKKRVSCRLIKRAA